MASSDQQTMFASMKRDLEKLKNYITESEQHCETLEKDLLVHLREELLSANQHRVRLERENAELQKLLHISEIGMVSNGGMTESLKAKVDGNLLQAKLANEELQERINYLAEEVQHLKQQISVYKEDFEMERKDREKAQGLISDLRKQIMHLTSERDYITNRYHATAYHQYTSSGIQGHDVCDAGHDETDCNLSYNPSDNIISESSGQTESLAKGVTESNACERDIYDLLESEDINLADHAFSSHSKTCTDGAGLPSETYPVLWTDASQSTLNFSSSKDHFAWPSIAQKSQDTVTTLSCPRCLKTFSTEDHILLIEHLEDCN